MLKKLALIFLSSLLFINSMILPLKVMAQDEATPDNWYNQSFENWFVKVYDPDTSAASEIFGERYTAAQVQWIIYSLAALPFVTGSELSQKAISCGITKDIIDCADTVGDFIKSILVTNKVDTNKSMASIIIRANPISGIGYISNLISKFSLVPEAQAQTQGFGYNTGGKFFLTLWQATRNMAYGLTVLVVIVMSFMIMFRVKISPQVVISVQSALPKVIFTVVLITFSYAIAGFMIDLMYVVLGLFSALVSQSGLTTFSTTDLFTAFASGDKILSILMMYWIYFVMGGFFALIRLSGGVLSIIAFVFAVFSILVLLWQTVKIFIMLLKAFVQIMLSIAIGPIQILTGAFIKDGGFGPWLKGLVAQLLIFPITAMMFFFAFYFLRLAFPEGWPSELFPYGLVAKSVSDIWQPPFLGNMSTGTEFFGGAQILVLAVSYTIMVSVSKVNEIIQGVITGRPFAYGTAIGEAAAPLGMYGKYAASEMGRDTAGSLPWPFNQIPQAQDWWRNSKGRVRGVARGVAEQVQSMSKH